MCQEPDKCCVCCPYGGTIAAPIVCSIVALACFNAAAFSCYTFKIGLGDISDFTFNAGYWSYEDWYADGYYIYQEKNPSCVSFAEEDEVNFDALFKLGRAIGIIGSILGYSLLVTILIASCVRFPKPKIFFKVIGGLMYLMAVFAALLLVGIAASPSDDYGVEYDDISLDGTGWCVIPSFIFWIAAGITTMFTMNERTLFQPAQVAVLAEQHVIPLSPQPAVKEKERIVHNPDGSITKTTTKITTLPDGTQSVKETVETL